MYIMDDLLKSIEGNMFFTLDMLSGYFQLPIHEDHQKYTTISTPLGLYYSDFIPDFSDMRSSLTAATSSKKGTEFVWTEKMD